MARVMSLVFVMKRCPSAQTINVSLLEEQNLRLCELMEWREFFPGLAIMGTKFQADFFWMGY